jgi:carboxyl-terminal processing protease
MTSRRAPLGPGLVLVLALLAGGWFLQRGVAQEQNVYLQSRLFQEIVDHISERFVERVDREKLYDYAIDGMIRELGDPNTSLLNVADYENFRIQTEGDYGGVGLEIVERDGFVTVVAPIPGTPGARAGIQAGDRIVGVDDESIEGWSTQRAVQVLRGRPGTVVDVTIDRPGVGTPIEFMLERERIQLRSVAFATLLDGGVGYIPLRVFSETSTREVRAAADSLQAEGARALILDLRGNPGGVLEQGIGIADLFLDGRLPVAETRGQAREQNQVLRSSSEDRFPDLPLVVLVDRFSASASEIVAGALQDHDRALVLGASTFGKGSVQTLFSLTGGNVLKLTTARWYTPAGRSIERRRTDDDEDEAEPLPALPTPDQPAAVSVYGETVLPHDTAGRPTVESMGGRTLFGGGGIVPDLLVTPDTLTIDEQGAVRTLYRDWGRYTTARFDYAVEYLQRNGADLASFRVGERELDELYRRLVDRGVDVDRTVWDRASRLILHQLEAEIALRGWGQAGEFERRRVNDRSLERALELLGQADSQVALFERAEAMKGPPGPPSP